MALKFCSFASGSSGNCYLVKSDEAALLVDVGITGKRILTGLEEAGVVPDRLNGILVTHEHVDHVRSLRMISRKAVNAKVYVSGGTLAEVGDRVSGERITLSATEKNFTSAISWSERSPSPTMQRSLSAIPSFAEAGR